ncbi:MAG: cysteine desulfurase [Bacilli bacterium]|nr:cysteine desulfurase [Bacilli bacterium]
MSANKMVYLDNAATTKPEDEVVSCYSKAASSFFGNANSPHRAGQEAAKALRKAEEEILSALGVSATHDLIFTSGATEANNLALKGVAFQYQNRGRRILSNLGEHSSVKAPLAQLKDSFGFDVQMLPIDSEGKLLPSVLEEAMDKNTILVSAMAVNNELGSINDVPSLANIVHRFPKAFLHVDATQSIGKIDLPYSYIDLFSFSGHKFGGLKGSGVLVYRKSIRFLPILSGGSQQNGFRSGTLDVADAMSLSLALRKAIAHQKEGWEKAQALSERLLQGLLATGECRINSPKDRLPYLVNFSLLHKKASVVVEALSARGIYVSSHAACDEKLNNGSPVLLAMGIESELAKNAIRVSFSYESSEEDVDSFLSAFQEILQEVRDR